MWLRRKYNHSQLLYMFLIHCIKFETSLESTVITNPSHTTAFNGIMEHLNFCIKFCLVVTGQECHSISNLEYDIHQTTLQIRIRNTSMSLKNIGDINGGRCKNIRSLISLICTPQYTPLLGSSRGIVPEPLFTLFYTDFLFIGFVSGTCCEPPEDLTTLKGIANIHSSICIPVRDHFGYVTVDLIESDNSPLLLPQLAPRQ